VIRIDRQGVPPPAWLAQKERDGLSVLRQKLLSGQVLTEKDFDDGIYAHADVKKLLWSSQHLKCCYCEGRYERKSSDVEHFRPKTEAVRDRKSRRKDVGYWWLAYRFDNLYFACAGCNRAKGALFPLAPRAAALKPEEDPRRKREKALLLEPGHDEPEKHLTFIQDPAGGYHITARGGSRQGKATAKLLQLDRDDLDELRNAYFQDCLQPVIDEFRQASAAGDAQRTQHWRLKALELTRADKQYSLLARVVFTDAKLWGDGIGPP
jgi:uncharacterized protein (TIGR02646 family)